MNVTSLPLLFLLLSEEEEEEEERGLLRLSRSLPPALNSLRSLCQRMRMPNARTRIHFSCANPKTLHRRTAQWQMTPDFLSSSSTGRGTEPNRGEKNLTSTRVQNVLTGRPHK